jgi:cell division septum initiation protein DivIVA
VLSWDAELEVAKKEIAELEERISILREELQAAQEATTSARVQRILAVREQHLQRAKVHARFLEHKIAQGCREPKPFPYTELATICFGAAVKRTVRAETADTLKALGSSFAAKGFEFRTANREPRPTAPAPAGHGPKPVT